MLKNKFILSLFFAIAISSCAQKKDDTNRVYFTIDNEDRKIRLPVYLNDSVLANVIFDTGATDGTFMLDSTFLKKHPSVNFGNPVHSEFGGSGWTNDRIQILRYRGTYPLKVCNTSLTYNTALVTNWTQFIQSDYSEGTFTFPSNDTTHVWELNFEHNYLEINQVKDFEMPKDCYLLSLKSENEGTAYIEFPIHLKNMKGDTVTINDRYYIDTGMASDIASMRPGKGEEDFLNKTDDAVWTIYKEGYEKYYTVNATMFDGFKADSLRVYTFSNSYNVNCNYVIGLNSLKRFNVFFDLKNKQIGLQPIKNFQRVVNPLHRRFHYSTRKTPDGRFIINKLADYKGNYYKIAGLQEGDDVVTVNGKPYKNITREERLDFYKQDTLIFDIIRKGKRLKITVHVDKNEQQGD